MEYQVNFEFLDEEAIENAITCLNYRMDKVVFFGDEALIKEKQAVLRYFLRETCEVGKKAHLSAEEAIQFIEISDTDLNDVITKMRTAIKAEEGNLRYIDITGGEGLALLAFGILAKELSLPMHLYDVEIGQMREFLFEDEKSSDQVGISLSKNGYKKKVPWNIETFVRMQGEDILTSSEQDVKMPRNEKDYADIDVMWKLMNEYKDYWTGFCSVLARFHSLNPKKRINIEQDKIRFKGRIRDVKDALKLEKGFYNKFYDENDTRGTNQEKSERQLKRAQMQFNKMMIACKDEGLIEGYSVTEYEYSYRFKNAYIAQCLKKAGNVLEQHVYQKIKEEWQEYTDLLVGVEIDWDLIDTCKETEVSNEIDVFVLKGYVPIFISCKAEKIANVDQDVLYELDVVARRLGGKYAKKILTVIYDWKGKHRERAKDMDIEVWIEKNEEEGNLV